MIELLNIIIVILLIITFFILMIGLIQGARSSDIKDNKINFFMKYRVIAQTVSLAFVCLALYLKSLL
tara:strand:- start:1349 stop:1549 length:201 start_codon:yes stop_codon:yes gene_type:complete